MHYQDAIDSYFLVSSFFCVITLLAPVSSDCHWFLYRNNNNDITCNFHPHFFFFAQCFFLYLFSECICFSFGYSSIFHEILSLFLFSFSLANVFFLLLCQFSVIINFSRRNEPYNKEYECTQENGNDATN